VLACVEWAQLGQDVRPDACQVHPRRPARSTCTADPLVALRLGPTWL
jgi:hypothetical protein